jgi:tellurite resistance-related uncharacterized protein
MKQLPENVVAYQHTLEFTNSTIPDGLFRAHSTKAGVWGLIVLLEGSLMYRILEPNHEEIRLSVERFGIIDPMIRHEAEAIQPVVFYVEFHRQRSSLN